MKHFFLRIPCNIKNATLKELIFAEDPLNREIREI